VRAEAYEYDARASGRAWERGLLLVLYLVFWPKIFSGPENDQVAEN
jgi:hypothetical protein